MKRLLVIFGLLTASCISAEELMTETLRGRWSEAKANAWYADEPWPVGANYVPRTAINQIEMWQAETFDPETINEELSWAASLGMNTLRVFLHDLVWQQDEDGFIDRIDEFLKIAQRHRIRPMLVFFDGVWDPDPYLGPQRPPRPYTHNSGWVQSPGRVLLADRDRHRELRSYVKGIMHYYANDARILAWDLFNEPDNTNQNAYGGLELADKADAAHALLIEAFTWAREVNPKQPITAGIWRDLEGWQQPSPIFQFMLANSDIITFHNYAGAENLTQEIEEIKAAHDRPVMCTEYMARGAQSTFDPHLGIMKRHRVGAYNWGLVDGKLQTKYPWSTWAGEFTDEPEVWHHDIFHADGTPYREAEVAYIRHLTGQK